MYSSFDIYLNLSVECETRQLKMRKHRNLTSHSFIFWQLLLCYWTLPLSLELTCSFSLSHSLVLCLSVCLQLKATAESMLMLTSASWESRCLRLINATRTSLRSLIYLLNCYAYISTNTHTHMHINTYWCKAMNCEQTTKKTKKSIANEIDTKEAQEAEEVEEEASKPEEGKQEGKRERTRQKFRFSSCQAANGTAYVAHRQEGVVNFSVLKRGVERRVHEILKLRQACCRKCGKRKMILPWVVCAVGCNSNLNHRHRVYVIYNICYIILYIEYIIYIYMCTYCTWENLKILMKF